jgi:hypothetical protein
LIGANLQRDNCGLSPLLIGKYDLRSWTVVTAKQPPSQKEILEAAMGKRERVWSTGGCEPQLSQPVHRIFCRDWIVESISPKSGNESRAAGGRA